MKFRNISIRRGGRRLAAALAAAAVLVAASNAYAQFVLRQDAVAVTGAVRVSNSCFTLSNAAGEAVAVPAVTGGYRLFSGFWGARAPTPREDLFRDSFEDCGP